MQELGKMILFLGLVLVFFGVLFLIDKPSLFGKLPGDILVRRENFTFYFPLTSSILLSLVLTLIFALISFFVRSK